MLRGRCLPSGEGITFWPLVEALTELGEPAALTLERLTRGAAAMPNELFWEVRRLLERVAAERPVNLAHRRLAVGRADAGGSARPHHRSLAWCADAVLCTERPELLEDSRSWGGGKLNATIVLLEPLDPADSE